MLPAALHLIEGVGVRVIAAGDYVPEMTILRLDDLVGCGATVLMLAGPA